MHYWEYKTIKLETIGWFVGGQLNVEDFSAALNALGKEGWELVSAFDTNQASGASREAIAVFKRPRD